jgi:hypothetical protein
LILSNEYLELEIQKPGEYYKSSRFDWTGRIIQISFDNKSFCTTETQDPELENMRGRGFYNEFGIDQSVGYDDCAVGDKFPKIGIGWLERDNTFQYDFFKSFKIVPAEFGFSSGKNSVTFISEIKPYRGYGYKLIKRIEIEGSSFTLKYSLHNTGDKPILTNEYVHNFLSVNNHPIDENYILKFPFQIEKRNFGKFVNPGNVISIDKECLTWTEKPSDQFFISNIEPERYTGTSWTLEHLKEKVAIRETVNFQILRINLWGSRHVVSPEIFYPVGILSGQIAEWERSFQIFKIQ